MEGFLTALDRPDELTDELKFFTVSKELGCIEASQRQKAVLGHKQGLGPFLQLLCVNYSRQSYGGSEVLRGGPCALARVAWQECRP